MTSITTNQSIYWLVFFETFTKGAQLQPLQQPTAQQPKPKLPIHTEVQISKSHKSEKSQTAKYILRWNSKDWVTQSKFRRLPFNISSLSLNLKIQEEIFIAVYKYDSFPPLSGGSSPSNQGDILDIGCLGGISLQLGLIQQILFTSHRAKLKYLHYTARTWFPVSQIYQVPRQLGPGPRCLLFQQSKFCHLMEKRPL